MARTSGLKPGTEAPASGQSANRSPGRQGSRGHSGEGETATTDDHAWLDLHLG